MQQQRITSPFGPGIDGPRLVFRRWLRSCAGALNLKKEVIMRVCTMFIVMVLLVGLPILAGASSISNRDTEVHQVKGRKSGENWVYIDINPNGTKYFNCRHGCELVLIKTGSSVQLETDGDVVIRHGELTVK
jgi:hypothetical protein